MKQSIRKDVAFLVVLALTGTFALPAWGYAVLGETLRTEQAESANDGSGRRLVDSIHDDLVGAQAVRDGADKEWNGEAVRADWDDIQNLAAAKRQLSRIADGLNLEALQLMAQIAAVAGHDLENVVLNWHIGPTPNGRIVEMEVTPETRTIHVYVDGERTDVNEVLTVLLDPANGLPANLRDSIMTLLDLYFPSVFAGEKIGEKIEARLDTRISGLERYARDLKTVLGDYKEGSEDAQALQREIVAVDERLAELTSVLNSGVTARDGGGRATDILRRITSLEQSIARVSVALQDGKGDAREIERLNGQLVKLQADVADLEVGKVLLPGLGRRVSQSVIGQAKKKPRIGEVEVITHDLGFLANNLDRATALAREEQEIKNYGVLDKSGIINVLLPYAVSPGEGGIPAAIHPEDIDKALWQITLRIRRYSGDETLSLTRRRFLIVPHEKLWDFDSMNQYISTNGYGHSMTRLFMRKQLVVDLRIEELARKSTVIDSLDIYTYDPTFLGNNQTGIDHLGKILESKPEDKVRITSIEVIDIPEQARRALEELRNALDALRKV